jgi:hypothetical protein
MGDQRKHKQNPKPAPIIDLTSNDDRQEHTVVKQEQIAPIQIKIEPSHLPALH